MRGQFKTALAALVLATAPALTARADPLSDGVAAFNAKDYGAALHLLTPLAAQGDAAAEFHLGLMRRFGLGVAEDDAAARALNLHAAENGYPQARQLAMAECLADADGSECEQALGWVRLDAEAGNVEDQAALGAMYLTGRGGVTKDGPQAVAWFRKAAARGDVRAARQLGAIYAAGLEGVLADPAQSRAWLRRAAELGDADAQQALDAASS